eukprot:UN28349
MTHSAHVCAECDTGYRVTGNICSQNICVCTGGTAAAGNLCVEHLSQTCTMCFAGYHMVDSHCAANVCTCSNGTAKTGAECTVHGTELCSFCNPGFHRTLTTCKANPVCVCENGTAALYPDCQTQDEEFCISCDAFFTRTDRTCTQDDLVIHCVGEWDECTVDCETAELRTFNIETQSSGGGESCPIKPYSTDDIEDCKPGDGNCPERYNYIVTYTQNYSGIDDCGDAI